MKRANLVKAFKDGPDAAPAGARAAVAAPQEMLSMMNDYPPGKRHVAKTVIGREASDQVTFRSCPIGDFARMLNGAGHTLIATYGVHEELVRNTIEAMKPHYDNKPPYGPLFPAVGSVDVISTLLNAQDRGSSINGPADIPRFTSGARYYEEHGGFITKFRDTSSDGDARPVSIIITRGRDRIGCSAMLKPGPMMLFKGRRGIEQSYTLIIHPEDIKNAEVLTEQNMAEMKNGVPANNPWYLPNTDLLSLSDGGDVITVLEGNLTLKGYYHRGYTNVITKGYGRVFTPLEGLGDVIFRSCPASANSEEILKVHHVGNALRKENGTLTVAPLAIPCVTLLAFLTARHRGIGFAKGAESDRIEYIGPAGEHGPRTRDAFTKALNAIQTGSNASVRFEDVTLVLAYYAVLHFEIHGDEPSYTSRAMAEPDAIMDAIITHAVTYYPGLTETDRLVKFRELLATTKTGHQNVMIKKITSSG